MSNFSESVILWYEKNKRILPWRNINDPYKIWISEIILQQTRVAQGYDYYLRFVERFPDLDSLAEAEEDEVLKYWQGLGYYSRARNLHTAAKSLQGKFPTTYEQVRAMKGVGDYTAAAICSLAYNMPHAVVDGNVYRVLSRYFGVETPIDTNEGKKYFASLADEMMDKQQAGLYNQAIMEFGALQCTPLSPDCLSCPLSYSCMALANNMINKLPVKQNKIKTRDRYFNYLYVHTSSHFYLHKRAGRDIWQGLYELPLIETEKAVSMEELIALPAFRELFPDENRSVKCIRRDVKHVLSHQIIYANFYEIILQDENDFLTSYIKVKAEHLDDFAFPKLIHSFLERILSK